MLKKCHAVLAQMVPSGEGRLKSIFEAILLHGGFAAVQQNTTLFFPLFPGAGLTPEFFNTLW